MGKRLHPFLMRSRSGPPAIVPPQLHRWLSATLIGAMMAISTVVVAAELPHITPKAPSREANSLQVSQRSRRQDIWQEVQEQLPNLPLENQYISSVTGEVSESNTLVRRMIEYHNFRKGRSPRSRFDWKLTLADYLGIHEVMRESTYPSIGKLTTNPIAGDRAAVRAMDRQQREQLINTIVSLYDPRIPAAFFEPAPPQEETEPAPEPIQPNRPVEETSPRPAPPPLAEPGAADLLRPRP